MIVKDRLASVVKANEVSAQIMDIISLETKDFAQDDDPAEQIYLGVHIVGNLMARMCIVLEGYGKTYAIPNLTHEEITKWVNVISKENIKVNK